jgi:hypothetical protein
MGVSPRREWPTILLQGWQNIGPLAHEVKGENGMIAVRQESSCEWRLLAVAPADPCTQRDALGR